jgi:carbamoyl-phosphate synthase small subunit
MNVSGLIERPIRIDAADLAGKHLSPAASAPPRVTARLSLEDGTTYEGVSFGSERSVAGEVVFNTGMMGYPETLTDPSYAGQLIVCTYPLVGNYGVPAERIEGGVSQVFESHKIHAEALIVADYSEKYSHWNAAKSLGEWLIEQGIPGITGIDTRSLTQRLRERGTMLGKIEFTDEQLLQNIGALVEAVRAAVLLPSIDDVGATQFDDAAGYAVGALAGEGLQPRRGPACSPSPSRS